MRTTVLCRGDCKAVSLVKAGQVEVSEFLFLISQLKLFPLSSRTPPIHGAGVHHGRAPGPC